MIMMMSWGKVMRDACPYLFADNGGDHVRQSSRGKDETAVTSDDDSHVLEMHCADRRVA